MPRLGFDYDSSYTDTDPYEPQPGGCCSLLPFFNDDLVELPITLPQDHTLFSILGQPDGALWLDEGALTCASAAAWCSCSATPTTLARRAGGAMQRPARGVRRRRDCWRALPREVAVVASDARASLIEGEQGGWRIEDRPLRTAW